MKIIIMSGNSYQKNGGVGVYNEIPNGASGGSSKKKMLMGAVAVVVVAIGGYFYAEKKPTAANVNKVMKKANLAVKANGKLKLIDEESESHAQSFISLFVFFVFSFYCDFCTLLFYRLF